MNTILRSVRSLQEFLRIRKPHKLAIQAKVHRQQAAVEQQENVFSSALDSSNALAFGKLGNMSRSQRFRGNRVQDVNTPDAPSPNQWTETANHSFYFGQFWHENRRELRSWF